MAQKSRDHDARGQSNNHDPLELSALGAILRHAHLGRCVHIARILDQHASFNPCQPILHLAFVQRHIIMISNIVFHRRISFWTSWISALTFISAKMFGPLVTRRDSAFVSEGRCDSTFFLGFGKCLLPKVVIPFLCYLAWTRGTQVALLEHQPVFLTRDMEVLPVVTFPPSYRHMVEGERAMDSATSAIPGKSAISEAIYIVGVTIESWNDDDPDELEQTILKLKGQMKKVEVKWGLRCPACRSQTRRRSFHSQSEMWPLERATTHVEISGGIPCSHSPRAPLRVIKLVCWRIWI